jgi:RimJ/RimL family protein N-acetyltransferase
MEHIKGLSLESLVRIETKRLILRKPELSDLDVAFKIHGDPETNKFNPNGPASWKTTQEMLRNWLRHWQDNGFGYWAVSTLENPARIIGFGGILYKRVNDRNKLNLYFRFEPSAWGHGYATELAETALTVAFDVLHEDLVFGSVRASNNPSRKILERVGMVQTDSVVDAADREPRLIYEITAEQFQKRPDPLF